MALAGVALLLASVLRWGWEAKRELLAVPGDTAVTVELLEASQEELEEEELRRRPLEDGELLDPNRAPAAQLDRLPGVGPAVALAIVQEREAGGFFRSARDLARVRGIGPATVEKIRAHLDFSRPPPARPALRSARRRTPAALGRDPGEEERDRIDVNTADEAELQELQGVGPALARRIVEFRRSQGPFRRVEDLLEVRGIGPAILEQLRSRVQLGH